MSLIAPGEQALAVIGVGNVITDDVPRIGIERLREMADLERQVEIKAKKLAADDLPDVTMPREHNYRALLDRMTNQMSPTEVEALVDRFPPEAHDYSTEFVIVVGQTFEHMKELLPVSVYTTFTGPENLLPADDKVWRFFSQLWVLNDPLVVFNLMAMGALLRSQVLAMQLFYPTLSECITTALYQAIGEAKAAKQSYRLPPRASLGVSTWLGRRTVDYEPNPKPPRAVPGANKPADVTPALATPTQQANAVK